MNFYVIVYGIISIFSSSGYFFSSSPDRWVLAVIGILFLVFAQMCYKSPKDKQFDRDYDRIMKG